MNFLAVRWLLSVPAAIFFCLMVSNLHEAFEHPGSTPTILSNLAAALLSSCIGLWVHIDARQRRLSVPYDFGSFIFIAWPLLVPIYLFKTRGWKGLIPLGWFILLYFAAFLSSVALWYVTPE